MDRLLRLTLELYRATMAYYSNEEEGVPIERPYGHFIHGVFCFVSMHVAIAPKVQNADAVLNEAFRSFLGMALHPEGRRVWAPPDDQPEAATLADHWLVEFLERWAAYLEIREGGNHDAAVNVICSMLRDAEATTPGDSATHHRLMPMAMWIEQMVTATRSAKGLPEHVLV